jgi:hypothetical protein
MADDDEVPRIPRGRGIKLSRPELVRILVTLGFLIAIVVLAKPCSDAVSKFVMRFDNGSAGSAMPRPGNVDLPAGSAGSDHYIHFKGMTDEQIKAAIEADRARHAGSAGSAN